MNIGAFYVHIPFCRSKCNYCDFVSADYGDKTADYADRYLEALVREFSHRLPSTADRHPTTVYIGGGTPSMLSEKQIKFLFETLLDPASVNLNPDLEITFEANPESITEEKLRTLKTSGVNRLSLGLQSFDDDFLRFLGRAHTKDDFLTAFGLARGAGFKNINVDLMFGIPGQTFRDWSESLESAIRLEPEHISVYCLTIEEGTNFKKYGVVTDDDLSAYMYRLAIEFLKKSGYVHYEISNFSRPGRECAHNINYWRNGQYLGLGLSAVSYIDGIRIKNTENLEDYLAGKLHIDFEKLDDERKLSENLILGLRLTEGIRLSDTILEKYSSQINNLKNNGLLEQQENILKLTDNGIMFANSVFREFL